ARQWRPSVARAARARLLGRAGARIGLRRGFVAAGIGFGLGLGTRRGAFDFRLSAFRFGLRISLRLSRRFAALVRWLGRASVRVRVAPVVGEVEARSLEDQSRAARQLAHSELAAHGTLELRRGIGDLAIEALEAVAAWAAELVSWHLAET